MARSEPSRPSQLMRGSAYRLVRPAVSTMPGIVETALAKPTYSAAITRCVRRQHVAMAQEIGLASAVTVQPAVVESKGYSNLHALPRFAWDGRQRSLRMMRVMLSGIMFPQVRPTRDNWFRA